MKNKFFPTLAFLVAFLFSFKANAFIILPPFKLDITVVINEVTTYITSITQNVGKVVQKGSLSQNIISTGKGAVEGADFMNVMGGSEESFEENELAAKTDEIREAEVKKTQKAKESADEIEKLTQEANAKIAEIDENQIVLRQQIKDDPQNARKYQRQISKNEKEKTKITKDLVKDIEKIEDDTKEQMDGLNAQISGAKNSISNFVTSITSFDSNYDSTEDLQTTVETMFPPDDAVITTKMGEVYKAQYASYHFADLEKALHRITVIKSGIEESNEKAKEKVEASDSMEGQVSSFALATQIKADNMQALINFTELLLQRFQVMISKDLANSVFAKTNNAQATADFNLDNYIFEMPDQTDVESERLEIEMGKSVEIESDLNKASEGIFSNANSTTSPSSGGSNNE